MGRIGIGGYYADDRAIGPSPVGRVLYIFYIGDSVRTKMQTGLITLYTGKNADIAD